MTAHIYNVETKDVVAILTSESDALINRTCDDLGVDGETYAVTQSPAFGFNDGLIETEAPVYDLDNGEAPESL